MIEHRKRWLALYMLCFGVLMGAFSLFTDPEGRMMGLWKAAK